MAKSITQTLMDEVEGVEMKETELFYNSAFRIKTPLPLLNFYTKGGFPSSSIIEVYGPPKAGKSTFTYMVAGAFQVDNPSGLVYIIDSEKSIEINRMKLFGMDEKRVIVQPVSYLEDAFIKLDKFISKVVELNAGKKGTKEFIPVMVIWDTIAATDTKARIESPGVMNPGGMNEKVRIIKKELATVSSKLEDSGVSVWIINQIYTHMGAGFVYFDSGGGFGLKHGAHFKIEVEIGKKYFGDDDKDFMSSYQTSYIHLRKTKSSPELQNIPLVINTLEGGIVDAEHSLLLFFKDQKILEERSKGWWGIPGISKNYRFTDLVDLCRKHQEMKSYYQDYFQYLVCKRSSYLRTIYFGKFIPDADLEKWFGEKTDKFKKFVDTIK